MHTTLISIPNRFFKLVTMDLTNYPEDDTLDTACTNELVRKVQPLPVSSWRISGSLATLPEDFWLKKRDYDKLYEHQKIGVEWLYNLFCNKQGCILADDMGMGKVSN